MFPAAAGRRLLDGSRQLAHHLGRRGAFLVILGTGWTGYGASIAENTRYGTSRGISILTHWAPTTFWGACWIAAGTIAITAGLLRRPRLDVLGFLCISVLPTVWGAAYAAAWYTGVYQPVWGSAIAWLAETGGFIVVSGWVELPRDTIRAIRRQGDGHGS